MDEGESILGKEGRPRSASAQAVFDEAEALLRAEAFHADRHGDGVVQSLQYILRSRRLLRARGCRRLFLPASAWSQVCTVQRAGESVPIFRPRCGPQSWRTLFLRNLLSAKHPARFWCSRPFPQALAWDSRHTYRQPGTQTVPCILPSRHGPLFAGQVLLDGRSMDRLRDSSGPVLEVRRGLLEE